MKDSSVMYLLRHLAHVALTLIRGMVKPKFWTRGVWFWLAWDALSWVWDAVRLVVSRSRRVRCDCCGWRGHRFFLHTFVSGTTVHRFREEICPGCESLGRQRQLVRYLDEKLAGFGSGDVSILDIGPGSADLQLFARRGLDRVLTMDLRPGAAMVAMDITQMGFKDRAFDVVVCSHVLEHVPDDVAGAREIGRILKEGGVGLIQVPVQPGLADTIEYGRPNPEEFDHVRTYGGDFACRLRAAGIAVAELKEGLFRVRKPSAVASEP